MKFTSNSLAKSVEIGNLKKGDTFTDPANFSEEQVFMVIDTEGYDCHVNFADDDLTIAVVNLTTGELWSYRTSEDVIPVVVADTSFKPAYW